MEDIPRKTNRAYIENHIHEISVIDPFNGNTGGLQQ